MIALATGTPTVRQEGERIIATIPSGNGEIEIALDFGQATRLSETMMRVVRSAIREANVTATAEIVSFIHTRKRKG